MKLFGIDIAKTIASAMGSGLLPAQLIKVVAGNRTVGALTGGTNPGSKTYSCRGFVDEFALKQFDKTSVQQGDKAVLLLGATLPVNTEPEAGDKIKILGFTVNIVNIMADPAKATWTCHCRG